MAKEPEQQPEPTEHEELEEREGEELPDREVMSVINPAPGDPGVIPVDEPPTDTDPWEPAEPLDATSP